MYQVSSHCMYQVCHHCICQVSSYHVYQVSNDCIWQVINHRISWVSPPSLNSSHLNNLASQVSMLVASDCCSMLLNQAYLK